MLSTRVIPCLDVHNGRTVKGINFENLIDSGNPIEQAKLYNDLGADELCFLDISATNEKRKTIDEQITDQALDQLNKQSIERFTNFVYFLIINIW